MWSKNSGTQPNPYLLTYLSSHFLTSKQTKRFLYCLPLTQTRFTLSLNLCFLFRMPHTRAIENGGLNTSPESSVRTPPSHQTRLLRVRSSRSHGSRHRAPLSLRNIPSISLIALSYAHALSHIHALRIDLDPHRGILSTQLNKIHSTSLKQYEVRLDD